MSEPIIEVRHLSKSFGTHVVLRDVDFTVKPGDVTCVIGASGSGKSTLLRCINLLETPTAGSILFHGQDIMAKGFSPSSYRARVGMVFQSFNLFNNMTVLENCTAGLRYVLHQDKETAKATALSNLEKVGMSPYIHARPRQLSGGQKQRVWIAMALAQDTKVLFLDEPTTYLDVRYQLQILKLIQKLNREYGITIVMVLHDINQSLYYSDEIVAMKGGKIIAQGVPECILTGELVKEVYDVDLTIQSVDGKPFVIPV